MENMKQMQPGCLAERRKGLTGASGLIIWRNYLPLATFSLREARRRYPQILSLQSFAKVCALCAHDLGRILAVARKPQGLWCLRKGNRQDDGGDLKVPCERSAGRPLRNWGRLR
jgi:hypothetical protein